jgi:hypothetical protein
MASVGEYSNQTPIQMRANPGRSVRDSSPPSDLPLTAMLVRRVRVERADGVQWMSGYEALASVLAERSAAGDTLASELLANLTQYAALRDARPIEVPGEAPPTEAEEALATAFADRSLNGLPNDEPGTTSSVPMSRAERRRMRAESRRQRAMEGA